MLSRLTLAGERMNCFELSSHDCSSTFSSTPPCRASVDPSVVARSMANLESGEKWTICARIYTKDRVVSRYTGPNSISPLVLMSIQNVSFL
jgi:hypothetical protein